jgi:hypothetical protein
MRCAVQFAGEILVAEFSRSMLDLTSNGKSFDDYFCFASVIRPRCGRLAAPRCAHSETIELRPGHSRFTKTRGHTKCDPGGRGLQSRPLEPERNVPGTNQAFYDITTV